MKIIRPDYEIVAPFDADELLRKIERAGRVCYKSEDKISGESAEKFAAALIRRGHEAVLEHAGFAVKFIVDRGVSHEIVRHRIAAYCQESTRYCNYSKEKFGREITVIKPFYFEEGSDVYKAWYAACKGAEDAYFLLLEAAYPPQEARCVLPTSLKTELVMTANVREWRHFLRLRTAPDAHPQMREVAIPLLRELQSVCPVLFEDINA